LRKAGFDDKLLSVRTVEYFDFGMQTGRMLPIDFGLSVGGQTDDQGHVYSGWPSVYRERGIVFGSLVGRQNIKSAKDVFFAYHKNR
jgi:hypothetical protein